MPELPEVETVCRGLKQILTGSPQVAALELVRGDLRLPVTQKELSVLVGQRLKSIRRRAKYLIFDFEKHVLVNHLGMTGSWRELHEAKPHDHLHLQFRGGINLTFNDPRRFGLAKVFRFAEFDQWRPIAELGPEPLDSDQFQAQRVFAETRKKQVSIKVWLMNQKNVVGVGNIYASEALFLAGVRPTRRAGTIRASESVHIVDSVQKVLRAAIAKGGTTIRDFRQTGGSSGYFQKQLFVYDRAGQPCRKCGNIILSLTLGGRSTYYCPSCQK